MKLPPPTTVSTVPPYRRLTAVKAITATVRQNARPLTATTAGTGVTTAVLTAANPIGATVLPSARPVMPTTVGTGATTAVLTVASPIGVTVLPSARPAMPITAGTERRFRCRPTPTARPTIPTARPNVPPGAVTQGIKSPEAHVTSLHLPAEVPEEIVLEIPIGTEPVVVVVIVVLVCVRVW